MAVAVAAAKWDAVAKWSKCAAASTGRLVYWWVSLGQGVPFFELFLPALLLRLTIVTGTAF